VNKLTDKFIQSCIDRYHDVASGYEAEDWAQNVQMQKRVCDLFFKIFISLFQNLLLSLKVVVNGFQGQEYSSSQTARNDIFRPKVAAVMDVVLKRTVSYSVQGRAGEVRCFVL